MEILLDGTSLQFKFFPFSSRKQLQRRDLTRQLFHLLIPSKHSQCFLAEQKILHSILSPDEGLSTTYNKQERSILFSEHSVTSLAYSDMANSPLPCGSAFFSYMLYLLRFARFFGSALRKGAFSLSFFTTPRVTLVYHKLSELGLPLAAFYLMHSKMQLITA